MKDFFTSCMKDLYALTGIEQVRWMQNDLANGKRDFELCVDGMVETSKKFDYIPPTEQQKIIRKMMVEDREYKALNSRTVWGWLNMHKDVYYRGQTHAQAEVQITYAEYLERCKRFNMTPLPESEWDKPVSEEKYQAAMDHLKAIGNREIIASLKGLRDEKGGTIADQLTARERARHEEWIKENFDEAGFKLPCYTPEDEWRELKGYPAIPPLRKPLSQGTSQFTEDMLTPKEPASVTEPLEAKSRRA